MFNLGATNAEKYCRHIKMQSWNNSKTFLIGFMQCIIIVWLKTNTQKVIFFICLNKIADTFEFAKTFLIYE